MNDISDTKYMLNDCGHFFDKADDPEPCKCRDIVLRTFDSLINSGMAKKQALTIASNVLKHHHTCSSTTAKTIVECWVHKHTDQHIH